MESIKEFLRTNGRALGIALVVVAVVIGISLTADNSDEQNGESDQASSTTIENSEDSNNVDSDNDTDNQSDTDMESEGSMDENDSEDAETNEESEQSTDESADFVDAVIGRTPIAGSVEIENENDSYIATVRGGDNQTVIVRQMVNDYLSDESKDLTAPQRLYMETTLVDSIGRDDTIVIGSEISLSKDSVAAAAEESESLSARQLELWATYL